MFSRYLIYIFDLYIFIGFLKAKLAFATEKYEEVIPACTEELNFSESESTYKIEALSLRASFYFLTGQFKEALDDLTAIIETKDADVLIRVNSLIKRASIYMQTDNIQDCLLDFDSAASLGPNVSGILYFFVCLAFSQLYQFKYQKQQIMFLHLFFNPIILSY